MGMLLVLSAEDLLSVTAQSQSTARCDMIINIVKKSASNCYIATALVSEFDSDDYPPMFVCDY